MKKLNTLSNKIYKAMKTVRLLLLFLFFSQLSYAQEDVILTVSDAVGTQDVVIDIRVENFTDIVSAQFSIHWDPTILELQEVNNFGLFDMALNNFGTTAPFISEGQMGFAYYSSSTLPVELPDGSILFSLVFNGISDGISPITIDEVPTPIEFANSDFDILNVIMNPGTFTSNGKSVSGKLYHDANTNCGYEDGEAGLGGRLIAFQGAQSFYTITDDNGYYDTFIAEGVYTVSTDPINNYWGFCDNYSIDLSTGPAIIDIAMQAQIDCPFMEVHTSAPFLRRCFDNYYTVSYCNAGTIAAADATVEVTLDPEFSLNSAGATILSQTGNTYVFDIGTVGIGECGNFDMNVYLSCDNTVLGQTHCLESHIYPDDICEPINPNWSGASIKLDAVCEGDSIRFFIENIGVEDMDENSKFIVIEDAVMYEPTYFQLGAGEAIQKAFYANGSTFRMEAEQVSNHPGLSMPSATLEGCESNGTNDFSVGYVTQFQQNDADAFIAIDCQENIGSYDPNDKRGFPKGYGSSHLLSRNTDINYHIRFQNTGTDTAFTVKVLDTLSTYLNPASIRLGASSHPYTLNILENNILSFTFNNIMLPDSNINEAASHGFVQFKIAQQLDLEDGTEIFNGAAIYFDFNEAVLTNETHHQIGEAFVVAIDPEIPNANFKVSVYPNPFTEQAIFEVEDDIFGPLDFQLINQKGQVVRNNTFQNSTLRFDRDNLSAGIYFYEIKNEQGLLSTGKIVIQ